MTSALLLKAEDHSVVPETCELLKKLPGTIFVALYLCTFALGGRMCPQLLIFSFPSRAYVTCLMQEDKKFWPSEIGVVLTLNITFHKYCPECPSQHVVSKQTSYELILVKHNTVLNFGVYSPPTACTEIAMIS